MEDTIIIEVTDASKPNHKVPLRPIDVLKIELDKLNLEVNSMKNEIKMLKVKVKSEKDLYTEKGWFF